MIGGLDTLQPSLPVLRPIVRKLRVTSALCVLHTARGGTLARFERSLYNGVPAPRESFTSLAETTVSSLDVGHITFRSLPRVDAIAMELFPVSILQHIARGLDETEVPAEGLSEAANTKATGDIARLPPILPLRDSCACSSNCKSSSNDKDEEEGKSELSDGSSFDDDGLKRPNDLYERYLFRIRTQRDGESHRKFLQALKDQAENCDFGESSGIMVRDQVIFGTNNAELRELMLGQRNLTMAKVEELCRAADEGTLGGHLLNDSKENNPNFRKRRIHKRYALSERNRDEGAICAVCNVVHASGSCLTQERMCYMCRRTGRFGPECTAGPVAIEDALEDNGESEECELFGWFHPDFFQGFGVFDEL